MCYSREKLEAQEDKEMKKIIEKIVIKYGRQICSLAGLAAMVSVSCCRGFFCQPEEPEGVKSQNSNP